MNKRFLLLLFAGCLVSHNVHVNAMEKLGESTLGKVGLTVLGGAAFMWATNKLAKISLVRNCCNKINVSPLAASQVLNLSGALVGISFFTEKDTGEAFRNFAWKAPLIGLVAIGLQTKPVREIISTIPGIGSYLVCPLSTEKQVHSLKEEIKAELIAKRRAELKAQKNDDAEIDKIIAGENFDQATEDEARAQGYYKVCKNSCTHCMLTTAIRLVAAWQIAKVGAPFVGNFINPYLSK